nr:3'-5' exonuclease [Streptomyces hygroscopicus]
MARQSAAPAEPLLASCAPEDLRRLGVADALIDLALTVTTDEELDQLIAGAPRLTAEVLTGLGSGMSVDEVEREITQPASTELDEQRWDAEFLFDEWEQIVLGQSLATRQDYFKARRAGMGRALNRPERAAIWKLLDQFTLRLGGLGRETWAQAAERAARYEMERARKIQIRAERKEDIGGGDLAHLDDNSSAIRYLRHRYQHIVVDEAQDLSPAHWKMLRAMVAPGAGDLFIASDTHQRIYDRQVTLSTVGVNIRGRSSKLTLSYRTTQEILDQAAKVVRGATYDDLDDGTDNLDGYHSLLHGPAPEYVACADWTDEITQLAEALKQWRADITQSAEDGTVRDPSGTMAVCVADGEMAGRVAADLEMKHGITTATLTKDGPQGGGEVHIGTMHRFKGLEYQKLAVIGASDGVLPRAALIEKYETADPNRYERELKKSRNQLFVATTRARDALRISWHGRPSPFLPL